MTDDLAARREPDTVAISEVDCTPRPRYRESREDFERRMAGVMRSKEELRALIGNHNREAALRVVTVGVGKDAREQFATRCGCGWHGLAVPDAEAARREYDTHACRLELLAEPGQTLHRKGDGLGAGWASQAKAQLAEVGDTPVITVTVDDAEVRMALLELK